MRTFQDTFEIRKWSIIDGFSIYMTVPLAHLNRATRQLEIQKEKASSTESKKGRFINGVPGKLEVSKEIPE